MEKQQAKLFKDYLASMTGPIPLVVKEAGETSSSEVSEKPAIGTTETASSPVTKGPVIEVADISQVEQLKKKGLLPTETADQIKAKLESKEVLSFEEAVALLDALNQTIVSGKKEEVAQAKES